MKSLGEEFKERKNELGITTEQLSRLSGIPIGTINKILNGETKSPRYATLKALNDVLFRDIDSGIDGIREAAAAYTFSSDKKQGEYTLDDYYALPDDVRAELIDGHLIFLEAPRSVHQELISELLFELKLYIRNNKGACKVLPAPLDVQLDCDNRNDPAGHFRNLPARPACRKRCLWCTRLLYRDRVSFQPQPRLHKKSF